MNIKQHTIEFAPADAQEQNEGPQAKPGIVLNFYDAMASDSHTGQRCS